MQIISIQDLQFTLDAVRNIKNADVQSMLAGCHRQEDARPLCMCTSKGIPLQVRKVLGIFYLAKMPKQGLSHAVDCHFFGETVHSNKSYSSGEKIAVSFKIHTGSNSTYGDTTLTGLLHFLWSRAQLNTWSKVNQFLSWKMVSDKLYEAAQGISLNGVSMSQLLWVQPSLDETLANQMRDSCINFIRSCNKNGYRAILIAPLGYSEHVQGKPSMRLKYRFMESPQVFVDAKVFSMNTKELRFAPKDLYPVSINLVSVPEGKHYLRAHDLSLLWVTPGYLPCSTKDRTKLLTELMETSEYLYVPLDVVEGKVLPEYAVIRKNGKLIQKKSGSDK